MAIDSPGGVRVWDLLKLRLVRRLEMPTAAVEFLAFSPDGRTLAVVGGRRVGEAINLWDIRTGRLKRRLDPHGTYDAVAYSPDGRLLAAAGGDYQKFTWVALFDAVTGKEIDKRPRGVGVPYSVAFSPDGQTLAIGDVSRVLLWEIAMGKEHLIRFESENPVESVAFSPDGRYLATGGLDVRLWHAQTGVLKWILR